MNRIVLTVAGSDPSGGAGIQQDMRVFTCLGLYSCAAITAITVQNTKGVKRVCPVEGKLLQEQVEAVLEDIDVGGIKVGMLATKENVESLATAFYEKREAWIVADPVMRSKNGAVLLDDAAWHSYEANLLPRIDILTPNLQEASVISSMDIGSIEEMEKAARIIYQKMGRKRISLNDYGVYLKGGHLEDPDKSVDIFYFDNKAIYLVGNRIDNIHTHGTGCALSSALCGYLSMGKPPEVAARLAKEFVSKAIEAGFQLGKGIGPVNPLAFLKFQNRLY